MNIVSLATKLTPAEIKANLIALARASRCHAQEIDAAFVKNCDPRALQGGAICDEAHEWHTISREIRAIAKHVEEWE